MGKGHSLDFVLKGDTMLEILYTEGSKGCGKFVQLRRWESENGVCSDVVLEFSCYHNSYDRDGYATGIKSESVPTTFERLATDPDSELIRYAIKKFDKMECHTAQERTDRTQ